MSIEVTILERIGSDNTTVLHHDTREVPPGMTRDKAVRVMLADASWKFQEAAKLKGDKSE